MHRISVGWLWWRVGQLRGARIDPVGNRRMRYFERAGNPSQVHPIGIQAHRLLARRGIIALPLGNRRVLPLAHLAQIALATRLIEPYLYLSLRSLAMGTLDHALILLNYP